MNRAINQKAIGDKKTTQHQDSKQQPRKTVVFDGNNPAYRELNAQMRTYNPS